MKTPVSNDELARELLDSENERNLLEYQTSLRKARFIKEIRSGLGDEIKENNGQVRVIKKSWSEKAAMFLKKLFTKF